MHLGRPVAQVFGKAHRTALRSVLTLVGMACAGIPRRFHLADLQDVGFALVTGGRRVLSRWQIWAFFKRLTARASRRFQTLTSPLRTAPWKRWEVSADDHGVVRWTKTQPVPKGYHSTRNKYTKEDRLYSLFEVRRRRFLAVRVAPGNDDWSPALRRWVRQCRQRRRDTAWRLLLDAAASKKTRVLADFLALPGLTLLIRACRRPAVRARWRRLLNRRGRVHPDPSPASRKSVEVMGTRTRVDQRAVRTVVAREPHGPAGKERYHGLLSTDEYKPNLGLIREFRQRQRHELAHRWLVHHESLDALPDSYARFAPPEVYQFDGVRTEFMAWTKALAYNLFRDFQERLGGRYKRLSPATLARQLLWRPGRVFQTNTHLVVEIAGLPNRPEVVQYVRWLNHRRIRIPWYGNRILVVSPVKKFGPYHLEKPG